MFAPTSQWVPPGATTKLAHTLLNKRGTVIVVDLLVIIGQGLWIVLVTLFTLVAAAAYQLYASFQN